MDAPGGRSLSDVRIAVIGAGAIGCSLLPRIARMPFSVITIVDGDRVEEKNLDRQELYAPVDIGQPKAQVSAAWLRNAPITADVVAVDAFVDARNIEELVAMHDIVADCTDDAHVRRLVDRTCAAYDVALVGGAVHAGQGQVIALHAPGSGASLLLTELFTGQLNAEQDGCDMRNVPLTVIEEVARRMSATIGALLRQEPVRNGSIDVYDGRSRTWMRVDPPELT